MKLRLDGILLACPGGTGKLARISHHQIELLARCRSAAVREASAAAAFTSAAKEPFS